MPTIMITAQILPDLPAQLDPETLERILTGEPNSMPPHVLKYIINQMQQDPELLNMGHQMFLKHQENLLKQGKVTIIFL